jgi:SAM-dependent methyltransferase
MASGHTSAERVAAAILVGMLVGCSPFFGFHLLICIGLGWLLGLNLLVLYGASNISIPPLVPFIGFAAVQLGERLLRGHWLQLGVESFSWQRAPVLAQTFFVDWLLGGMLVGGALGITAGTAVYAVLRARKGAPDDPLAQASARYRGLAPQFLLYAQLKYRMDPCYRVLSAHVPPGSLTVDLGTGLGMLPVFLAALGGGRRALGVEWDAAKVAAGKTAAQGLDAVELVEGDVRAWELPACDVITLVDVLHYYDADTQRSLLQRCRAALRPGGRLLVREGDRQRAGGAVWTRLVERVMVRFGWNRGPAVRFRPVAELRADLEALGFRVRVDEVAGKLHPGNVLLVCEPDVA